MKKILLVFILLLLPLQLLACSTNKETSIIKEGTYVLEQSDSNQINVPTIMIEGNHFTFSYDILSSYLSNGTYDLKENIATMTTEDGLYSYVFLVENGVLIFQKDKSSDVKLTDESMGIEIIDQAKFKIQTSK
ncbi:hypothetical protein [Candidatus Galacturonibacter soehngenii]|uniref:Copper resistance protein NlpE n=1 Tax=Candidatus Galacturonatibacter soehngenii TaxID=2307010 RepID=A0A7V7QKT1_9FIRM|nr:hypothetical protein [Candidatus Galacturonibacter soehngenii]KAB1438460.1 hypothetical protein F7O84_13025 [Candidatus Galacturonibacter soehngenii]